MLTAMSNIDPLTRKEQFLIDGLVPSTMGILSGEPMAGKSMLTVAMAAALVEQAPTFLGRPVTKHLDRVAFGLTDPDAMSETRTRIGPLLTDLDRVLATNIRNDGTEGHWQRVTDDLVAHGVQFFILDNVLGALAPGEDISRPETARSLLDGLDAIMRKRIAILIVTHTAKPGSEGYRVSTGGVSSPIGGRLFGARPRAVLSMTRTVKRGVQLRVDLNHGAPNLLDLSVEVRADMSPAFEATKAKMPTPRRARIATGPAWREKLVEAVEVDHPKGSARMVADQYKGKFGRGSGFENIRASLADGSLGLAQGTDGVWRVESPTVSETG